MQHFEIVVIVFAILIALLAVADRYRWPVPVLLVIAGLSLGFIPSLPELVLSPDVVFFLFLPPILYDAATHTSWHDFKADIRPISTLAITLVFLTTTAVAITCYVLIPGFTWVLGFVLGAIVSPPDAVAATSITRGLGLNKRVITILQGESLVNDASALIAYRFAIAAVTTGSFIFWQAGIDFLIVVAGGVLAGVVTGYIMVYIHKRIRNNSIISTSLTLLTPFVAYLTAEQFHTSGVLAVVCTGLIISWRAPDVFSYQTRIRNLAVWDTVIFLLNGFIFILIGLQFPLILQDLKAYTWGQLTTYGLVVSLVTIIVRILWVFVATYMPFGKKRVSHKTRGEPQGVDWKNVLIVAWTGTRGVVSLAAALALPLTLPTGDPFPQRSLILFLTFVVIFMTLVVQGLSLPLLIRMLGIKPRPDYSDEERELRLLMASSVVNFIDQEFPVPVHEHVKAQIKKRYTELIGLLEKEREARSTDESKESVASVISPFLSAQGEINKFQRQLLIGFHKSGAFSQSTIRRLEQELDHEDLQLNRMARRKK